MIKMTKEEFLDELKNDLKSFNSDLDAAEEEMKTDGCMERYSEEDYGKGYLTSKPFEIRIELKK